jgi:hypothetical protein
MGTFYGGKKMASPEYRRSQIMHRCEKRNYLKCKWSGEKKLYSLRMEEKKYKVVKKELEGTRQGKKTK